MSMKGQIDHISLKGSHSKVINKKDEYDMCFIKSILITTEQIRETSFDAASTGKQLLK